MKITCRGCGTVLLLKQERPYHAGFSNRGFLYCDACPALVKFDAYDPNYVALVGDVHPWALSSEQQAKVEQALKPCCSQRGGRFRFGAKPRCTACNIELTDVAKDPIHFVEIGEVRDGDTDDIWL